MHTLPPRYIAFFLLATILVITTVLGALLTLLQMNHKRRQNYLTHMAALLSAHTQDLLRTRLEMQEQTFRDVAREIHDNINLSLTLAKLSLHRAGAAAESVELEEVQQLISDAIRDLSTLSRGLNPDFIQQLGLVNAIKAEIERIHRSATLRIEFEVTGETLFIPPQTELILFRSVQECFNNILKHSAAGQAALHLEYRENYVQVRITDDGVGFEPADLEVKRGQSTGLCNLRTRMELFSGSLRVRSLPGKGTQLQFELPIKESHEHLSDNQDRTGRRPHPA